VNDDNYLGVIDDCKWCSRPVYADDDYEAGDDGEGVMHTDCEYAARKDVHRQEARLWAVWGDDLERRLNGREL